MVLDYSLIITPQMVLDYSLIITVEGLHKIIRTHSNFKTRNMITPSAELNTSNERKSTQNRDCKKRF